MLDVLVTGGAGYIGSHGVRALQNAGYRVTVLDNLSTGFRESLDNCFFVKGDVGCPEDVAKALSFRTYAGVVHFAGSIEVGESVADPLKYYKNNFAASLCLLQGMKQAGVNKLIFSSTAAVYGDTKDTMVREDSVLSPVNPYGRSKLMVEKMLLDAASAYGLQTVILRYFNVAGADPAGENGDRKRNSTHLIANCLRAVVQQSALRIFGADYSTHDGTGVRDYIHVADLARAHVASLEYLLAGGCSDVFNCGYGKGFSVRQVIETTQKVTRVSFPTEIAPRRAGDPAMVVADVQKIHNVLNWQPEYADLAKIIYDAWQWEKRMK